MKKYQFLILILFLTCCNSKKDSNLFIINGVIKGDVPKYIYLEYNNIKDSALVLNGKFKFEGKVLRPTESNFYVYGTSAMIDDYFYIENNAIDIEITIEKKIVSKTEVDFIKVNAVTGSETENIRNNFKAFERQYNKDENWNDLLYNKLNKIIEQNPNNPYSIYLLDQENWKRTLSKKQLLYLYQKFDTSFLSNKDVETIRAFSDPEGDIKIGNKIADFQLLNTSNKMIKTQDFRGKILLIDFWASWCVPCREQNPEMLKVFTEYKNKGFSFLAVSLDKKRSKWIEAIKKDKLTWENVVDILAFQGKIAARYRVTAIPINFLVDKNGILIAKDITSTDLSIYLENNLK